MTKKEIEQKIIELNKSIDLISYTLNCVKERELDNYNERLQYKTSLDNIVKKLNGFENAINMYFSALEKDD